MIEIGKRPVGLNTANAKQAKIDLVFVKHRLCLGADDIAIGQAQRATGNDNPVAGIVAQRHGGIHVVGDHGQVAMIGQIKRDQFKRAADPDQDGGPVRDQA